MIELPAAEAPAAGNQMKATLKLLGRSVFNADAAVEASPTGGAQMSFDFGGARFVAAGPTDLELRLADAPSNAEPIAQARIRTKQPLLTAPVIGAILLALYAIFTLEATNRTLTRRKKRAIGSIIGAGILGILLAASFAVLTWGLLGRVPGAPGVVVALVLGCVGGVGIAIGGVRRGVDVVRNVRRLGLSLVRRAPAWPRPSRWFERLHRRSSRPRTAGSPTTTCRTSPR